MGSCDEGVSAQSKQKMLFHTVSLMVLKKKCSLVNDLNVVYPLTAIYVPIVLVSP